MGATLAFVLFISTVYGAIQPVLEAQEDVVVITIDDLEDVEFVEKSANETDVNETSLEDDLEPLQIDDDERLDIEYIKKNFNSTSTSLNNTGEVEFEEYDVEEEKDEITAPDNQDDEEEQEENDQTLVEKS